MTDDDNLNPFADFRIACATNEQFNERIGDITQVIESKDGSTAVFDFGPSSKPTNTEC